MALRPEDDQMAVLAPATLPERKQVAEAGILASERPSDFSNGVSTKPPIRNKLIEMRKGKKQKHEQNTTAAPQLRAAYQLPPLPHQHPPKTNNLNTDEENKSQSSRAC